MSARLEGKVAIVTGSSTGIGAGIARALAAEGASVVVNYHANRANGGAVVSAIASAGGKAIAYGGDVSRKEHADGLVETAIARFGKLDILVNNAGIAGYVPIEDFSEDSYKATFDLNVLATFLVTAAAVKHLGEGASIINISSVITAWASPHASIYAASKAAVDALTAVLANELGPRRIRVNSIKPGVVVTERIEAAWEHVSDQMEQLRAQTPAGRLGRPEDIGRVAVFLASEDSAHVTGECISVSGGFHVA